MNKTKKRAAKRAALNNTTVVQRPRTRKPRFLWPFPLTPLNKIKNLKAHREYYDTSFVESKIAVETAMSLDSDMPF